MTTVIIVLACLVLAWLMIFLAQGPPFVASDDDSARQILRLVAGLKPKYILDMGSGDGKLVILLASHGYKVDGIELNPLLVLRSRRAIRRAGLTRLASVKWGNFWRHDVAGYDLVVLYAVKHIMPKLEQKLSTELPPGARIVSNYFEFPHLKPVKSLSRARLYKV